jgi:hypothetical protein
MSRCRNKLYHNFHDNDCGHEAFLIYKLHISESYVSFILKILVKEGSFLLGALRKHSILDL